MKLTALTVLIILLAHTSANSQKPAATAEPQLKSIEELEAKLKELDELPAGKVTLKADKKFPNAITLKVEMEVTTVTTDAKSKTETFFIIDFSKYRITEEYVTKKINEIFKRPGSSSCPGVAVMQIDASVNYSVVYDYPYKYGNHTITAWQGFVYDRASIPSVFWAIIDKDSLSNVAPLFHDLLYRHGGVLPTNRVAPYRKFSRDEADNLFLELMEKCGVGYWRRHAAYQAVKQLAKSSWKEP